MIRYLLGSNSKIINAVYRTLVVVVVAFISSQLEVLEDVVSVIYIWWLNTCLDSFQGFVNNSNHNVKALSFRITRFEILVDGVRPGSQTCA